MSARPTEASRQTRPHRRAPRDAGRALAAGDADTTCSGVPGRSGRRSTHPPRRPARSDRARGGRASGPVFPASARRSPRPQTRSTPSGTGGARPSSRRPAVVDLEDALQLAPSSRPAPVAGEGDDRRPATPPVHGAAPPAGGTHPRARRSAAYASVRRPRAALVVLLALSAQRAHPPLTPKGPGPTGPWRSPRCSREQGVEVEVVRSIAALEAAGPDPSTTVLVGGPTPLGPGATERLGEATRSVGRLVLVGGTPTSWMPGPAGATFPGGVLETSRPVRVDREDDVVSRSTSGTSSRPAHGADCSWSRPRPHAGEPLRGARSAPPSPRPAGAPLIPRRPRGPRPAWTNGDHEGRQPPRAWRCGPRGRPGSSGTSPGRATSSPRARCPGTQARLSGHRVPARRRCSPRDRRHAARAVRGADSGSSCASRAVVVRAIETTESRGRLYRRAGDRERAAAVLRAGPPTPLPPQPSPAGRAGDARPRRRGDPRSSRRRGR